MKVCVRCHDEYRDEISTCLRCGIPLEQHVAGSTLSSAVAREQVDMETAIKVMEGPLAGCKEVESLLKQHKVACMLVPVVVRNVTSYAVCINADRVEDYMALMSSRFGDMVQKEHGQDWALQEVHLDGGDVTCPACGHQGPLQEGQCSDCGLMLGVNEG
jgi:hypothetical protein